MSTPFQTIKVNISNCKGEIVLNRPEKRNAINPQMIRELDRILSDWENDGRVKVIILKGKGKAFCSGADLTYLKELRNYDYQKNLEDSMNLSALFLKIYSYPKPIIAVVQGAALAGGCGLATVCDLIFATPDAKFGYPEVKIGFVAAIVSTFLIRQIGERKARELLLSGRIISADTALQMGLINQVIAQEELNNTVDQWAEELINNGTMAMKTTKQLFSNFQFQEIKQDVADLAKVNAKFRQTEEFIEGISAFLEKRKPNWQNRSGEEKLC